MRILIERKGQGCHCDTAWLEGSRPPSHGHHGHGGLPVPLRACWHCPWPWARPLAREPG